MTHSCRIGKYMWASFGKRPARLEDRWLQFPKMIHHYRNKWRQTIISATPKSKISQVFHLQCSKILIHLILIYLSIKYLITDIVFRFTFFVQCVANWCSFCFLAFYWHRYEQGICFRLKYRTLFIINNLIWYT